MRKSRLRWAAFMVLGLFASGAKAFELSLPLDCRIGENCWIQQYPDHDPGSAAVDYKCSSETYDGHDGTDFRVLNTTSDVNVIAAAPGTVVGIRDGMQDQLASTPELLALVAKKECGNGVLIAHSNGFETQYCHMRNGSVVVKRGQQVAAGTILGKVGYSGAAAFAHVHLSLRHNGAKLDPFSGPLDQPCSTPPTSLWSTAAQEPLAYHEADVIEFGWTQEKPDLHALEQGPAPNGKPQRNWPALISYARIINLRDGDMITLTLRGPQGTVAVADETLNKSQAERLVFAGKRLEGQGLSPGAYSAKFTLRRNSAVVMEKTITSQIE